MKHMRIALYGINRIGKSTQAGMLVDRLEKAPGYGGYAAHIKFPVYALEPTGPLINNYLREVDGEKNPHGLSPREFQLLNIINRKDFAPTLRGIARIKHVVLEDYVGTGIAWGIGAGVDKELLFSLNSGLPKTNVNILLDGKPFLSGTEKGHTHEENDTLTFSVRRAHIDLAKEFHWHVVDANRVEQEVHSDIWRIVDLAFQQAA